MKPTENREMELPELVLTLFPEKEYFAITYKDFEERIYEAAISIKNPWLDNLLGPDQNAGYCRNLPQARREAFDSENFDYGSDNKYRLSPTGKRSARKIKSSISQDKRTVCERVAERIAGK